MAVDLADLVDPAHTALVTQECQRAIIGDAAVLPALADEAQREAVPNIATLVRAARAAGVPVLHCLAVSRADGRGGNRNARLFQGTRKRGIGMEPGSRAAEVLPEIGVEPDDIVLTRLHGLGPMGGTELDPVLRNLGVTTVVGVGVSVNVGMTSFAMDAVNAGYQFVLPRDAVAGVPRSYAEAVVENTLAYITTVTSTNDVVAAWKGADG